MSGPHVVTIVQARSGSSRMPGKALRPLKGRPMVLHAMDRAREMGFETWLATSSLERDDLLASIVHRAGYPVFRGDERDVLHRMWATALLAEADVVVRVTGDCPCFSPDVGRTVVEAYLNDDASGIVTNDTSISGWPDGLDCEVFSIDLLDSAQHTVPEPANELDHQAWRDREHVTPWMRRVSSHRVLRNDEDWRSVKLSVDTMSDFERVSAVMGRLEVGQTDWPSLRLAAIAAGLWRV